METESGPVSKKETSNPLFNKTVNTMQKQKAGAMIADSGGRSSISMTHPLMTGDD
jgi:hypothetical protein